MQARCDYCRSPIDVAAAICAGCKRPNRLLAQAQPQRDRPTDPPPAPPSRNTQRPPASRESAGDTTPPPALFQHARVAEEAENKLAKFGIQLDGSPASLAGIDAFITSQASDRGFDLDDPGWVPTQEQESTILMLGSYTGEVVRRVLGGDWSDDREGENVIRRCCVVLPGGTPVRPLYPVYKRYRWGSAGSCWRWFNSLASTHGAPPSGKTEAASWARFGQLLLGAGDPREARELLQRAVAIGAVGGEVWVAKGESEEKLGMPDDAITSYRRAIWLLAERPAEAEDLRRRIKAIEERDIDDDLVPVFTDVDVDLDDLSDELELIPEDDPDEPRPASGPRATGLRRSSRKMKKAAG